MTPEELFSLRDKLGLSQDQFAARLDMSREHYNKFERGKLPISKTFILKINSLFGAPTKQTDSKYLIPFFEIEATATPMELFEDKNSLPHVNLDLPGYAGCDFAINVAGHGMYPTIESGSMILCKKITDMGIIIFGEVYFIITADHRFVRRINKSNKKGYVVCAPDNRNGIDKSGGATYQDVEIPLAKIVHLFIVKGAIKRVQI